MAEPRDGAKRCTCVLVCWCWCPTRASAWGSPWRWRGQSMRCPGVELPSRCFFLFAPPGRCLIWRTASARDRQGASGGVRLALALASLAHAFALRPPLLFTGRAGCSISLRRLLHHRPFRVRFHPARRLQCRRRRAQEVYLGPLPVAFQRKALPCRLPFLDGRPSTLNRTTRPAPALQGTTCRSTLPRWTLGSRLLGNCYCAQPGLPPC